MEIEIKFFSQQIRHLREEHQLTQEELAHELGVSRQSIIAFERGRCLPSLPLAVSLADFFDMGLENIFLPERLAPAETFDQPVNISEKENGWELRINLPGNVKENKIKAELKDGTLIVSLPKRTEALPKVTKIKVKRTK